MSWKSLVCAGLLCVLASPVFAVPNLTVSSGGLDASTSNWIWNATITPTTTTSPIAGELGFRETVAGAQLISASKGTDFTGASTDNPGTQIFTWEVLTDQGGGNMKPQGLQTNCASGCTVNGSLDEVFAALGSIADVTGASQYVQIITARPTTTRLTTSLQVLGKYGTGGTNGRIAEITTGSDALNYSNFAGTATRTILLGDLNGNGSVSGQDLADLAANFGAASGKNWRQGDTTGDGAVSGADLADLASKFGQSGGSETPININGIAGGAGATLGGG